MGKHARAPLGTSPSTTSLRSPIFSLLRLLQPLRTFRPLLSFRGIDFPSSLSDCTGSFPTPKPSHVQDLHRGGRCRPQDAAGPVHHRRRRRLRCNQVPGGPPRFVLPLPSVLSLLRRSSSCEVVASHEGGPTPNCAEVNLQQQPANHHPPPNRRQEDPPARRR